MISFLLLGFLMGVRHAFEADHILAVATLVESNSSGEAVKQGVVWGLGHTLTILIFGAVFVGFDFLITPGTSYFLEFIVGIMLVLLGLDLLKKIYVDRVHLHTHKHEDGVNHLHLHAHHDLEQSSHSQAHHNHSHPGPHSKNFPMRALLIGFMHGMAGSSVLIILILQSIQSPLVGLIYILLFGLGSILSMALASVVIAIPVRKSLKSSVEIYSGLRGAIATITLLFGAYIIYDSSVVSGIFGVMA